MTRIWPVLGRSAAAVRLAWVTVSILVVTATLVGDGTAAVVGAGIAIAVVLSAVACGSRIGLSSRAVRFPGEIGVDRHRRGAFRRQSAPDTPGRPRRPRAPGRIPTAA
ncbi:DUF6412 domain-containing protein [Nocardia sp. CC227C]|uniref:DUF6412 domain-containing protein n=1 Tax=Nocardia sp. CC227C TaxID=3044562 RepID=UPI00278C3C68|nr:DUF6412 domain-containing protein [Nocardia sp. CC227C]